MQVVNDAADSIAELASRIKSTWTPVYSDLEALMLISHGYQNLPLAPNDLADLCDELESRILSLSEDQLHDIKNLEYFLERISERCDAIKFTNLASDMNSVAKSTIDFLLWVSAVIPPEPVNVNWDRVTQRELVPKALSIRLRALEARLTDLEPRSASLDEKVTVIESAYSSADNLPVVLEELRQNRAEIASLAAASTTGRDKIAEAVEQCKKLMQVILETDQKAKHLVEQAEETYRISVTGGLAAAFEARARSLGRTRLGWISILVVSIGVGIFLGTKRLDQLHLLIKADSDPMAVGINLLASVVGIGGPLWLAWLSTRNIGHAFKLAEDYAFKASISKAYEGYRREAMRVDPKFVHKLFDSALSRLDELPSRVLEAREPDSPLADLLENESFRKLASESPELANRIIEGVSSEVTANGGLLNAILLRRQVSPSRREGGGTNEKEREAEE